MLCFCHITTFCPLWGLSGPLTQEKFLFQEELWTQEGHSYGLCHQGPLCQPAVVYESAIQMSFQ